MSEQQTTPIRLKKPTESNWLVTVADGFLYGSFVSFLLVVFVFLVERERVTEIQSVVVFGSIRTDETKIAKLVDNELKSNCFIFATCNHGLWYSLVDFSSILRSKFPLIDSVQIVYRSKKLLVRVSEREPVALWCTDVLRVNCYFIDKSGTLFEHGPNTRDYFGYVAFYPDRERIAVSVDTGKLPVRLFSLDEMVKLTKTITELQQYSIPVIVMYTKRDIRIGLIQLYGKNIKNTWLVLNRNSINADNNTYLVGVVNTLERFKTYTPFSERFIANPEALEYLDLRFSDNKKIYLKFKQ